MKFEYDDAKNRANIKKHDVSFDEAREAFTDPDRKVYPDKLHSESEVREICLGKVKGNIMTVVFTKRKDIIRIISAGYYRKGKKLYDKG